MRDIDTTRELLAAARGDIPSDLLIVNALIVNVFNGEITLGSVGVHRGVITSLDDCPAIETVDLQGRFLAPGFIEGHIHIESSKLTPERFGRVVLPHGTTTVVADPHEIANVQGIAGIEYMIRSARQSPLDVFYMLPSCVPATDMETAGATLDADDLAKLLHHPEILGIGEVMNFPGAYLGDERVLRKIALAGERRPVDGHSPGLSGKPLAAYILAGPATDHECFTLKEAQEKLALGMRVFIREGSTAHNLADLLPLVTPLTERRCSFVSDDRRPGDLLEQGHLDHILRKAVKLGLDPVTAIRMVTLNTAEAFGMNDRGGVKPGMIADLVELDNLNDFKVNRVWKAGVQVAESGRFTGKSAGAALSGKKNKIEPLKVPTLSPDSFRIADPGGDIRIIKVVPDQIITRGLTGRPKTSNRELVSDTGQDILKLVVIERHTGRGGMGLGFVKGMGLMRGALASTVAHDSHNIIAVGVDDLSLATACNSLIKSGGGQVAVEGDRILAKLALPIAGLMSEEDANEVAATEESLIEASHHLGCTLGDPLMALSFLALPVIPELKLTDRGYVDVTRFEIVGLTA